MLPPVTRSKLLLGDLLSMTQRGILNDLTFNRFLGDYD